MILAALQAAIVLASHLAPFFRLSVLSRATCTCCTAWHVLIYLCPLRCLVSTGILNVANSSCLLEQCDSFVAAKAQVQFYVELALVSASF